MMVYTIEEIMKPSLLILAAGKGSRYGGSKQTDNVGPNGACLFDYTIYDALKSGFEKVVFLITKEMAKDFKTAIHLKYQRLLNNGQLQIEFVFQELEKIPLGIKIPDARKKPWGTGHAILSAKKVIFEPFVVVNADDYYGQSSYKLMYETLIKIKNSSREFFMVGFQIINTVSHYGGVSRGVCNVSNKILSSIVEKGNIKKEDEKLTFIDDNKKVCNMDPQSIVSMNFWGFAPDTLFPILEEQFNIFIQKNINSLEAEFYIPTAINYAIKNKQVVVKVLKSKESWFGMTYPEDKDNVKKTIMQKILEKKYPENLFAN